MWRYSAEESQQTFNVGGPSTQEGSTEQPAGDYNDNNDDNIWHSTIQFVSVSRLLIYFNDINYILALSCRQYIVAY